MKRICLLISILFLFVIGANARPEPRIPEVDRIRIAEAFRIGEKLQDRLWAGWSAAPFSLLFVTDEHEFLIRHPKPNDEFKSIGYDELLSSEIFVRPRKFQKELLATFPAFGMGPVIVIGKAENTADKTSTPWVFVLLHEHFHQLQYSQPDYYASVNALDLSGGDTTGMWQINFAFPYEKGDVAKKFKETSLLLLEAYRAQNEKVRGEALSRFYHSRNGLRSMISPADYRYMSFQNWQEGIARYTQYRMAELASRKLKPSRAFRELSDFTTFRAEADRLLRTTLVELRDLELADWKRTVFYPFGAVEGLVLDKTDPRWRTRYLEEKFSLDDLQQ
ncbi:MAG TPA: hypothetical protein VHL50_08120 [Pyrinomonadaceae bacterium]|nr:hypothetical protein [Pyrinomonadaceae bacterium]